jgi:uncharacterized paraquat-inducible protein A
MSRIAIYRDTLPFCSKCGWRPVPEKGARCRKCLHEKKRTPGRDLARVVAILLITALLTLAARWAFAVREIVGGVR